MAAKTKIHVKLNGEPVAGATVYVGELLGAAVTTDQAGMAEFTLANNFEGFVTVFVDNVPIVGSIIKYMLLREGRTHQLPIVHPI